jgi:hypothetical protein
MIHPGIVGDGPYWRDRDLSHMAARTPCGRLARMADIAGAVAFLLRNPAVNGVSLNVDGGTLLGRPGQPAARSRAGLGPCPGLKRIDRSHTTPGPESTAQ